MKMVHQYKNGAPNIKIGQSNGKLATKLKIGTPNTKMAQAIFLPGAWGKIPVFMGKNHPTPGVATAFLHAQKYPPKTGFLKNF